MNAYPPALDPDRRARDRRFADRAVAAIEADLARSADTHLVLVPLPGFPEQDLYLKDESTHVTGSLKHRLARSLFLYAIANGWLTEGTTVVEASSGSTAVSEAYFARLVGLPFIAVMPRSTAEEKVAAIRFQGGECRFVERPGEVYAVAAETARDCGGHYMDQFTHAERATDWRGNNNIAESIFQQMRAERHPVPEWIVVGAGTGGTSATIGRYLRYRRLATRLCLADPEASVFHRLVLGQEAALPADCSPCLIEGIGRPRVEPSFVPELIDRAEPVEDGWSIAAARRLSAVLGRRVGGSTGTNFVAALRILSGMRREGRPGSVVTLLCDAGERYLTTCFNDEWIARRGLDLSPAESWLDSVLSGG